MRRYAHLAAVAIGAAAIILFGATVINATLYQPQAEIATTLSATFASTSPELYPKRLSISAINLDVPVQHAGLIAGNRMAAPTNFTDVAWYKYGPAPGALGSAVIAGHLDNGLGLAGVFKNLDQLAVGDDIEVTAIDGTTRHFIVEKLVRYPYNAVPSTIFTAADTARLNLITCSGRWIQTKDLGWTVDHRLVVYAVLRN